MVAYVVFLGHSLIKISTNLILLQQICVFWFSLVDDITVG
jgi:hypothetical protein